MPVVNPYSKLYGWWCAYVLFMDATYTAFVVPIGVGFNTSSVQWDWVGYFDFIAGKTFLCMNALIVFDMRCLPDIMQHHAHGPRDDYKVALVFFHADVKLYKRFSAVTICLSILVKA